MVQAVSSSGTGLSRSMRKPVEAEKRIDATVYEYDEVWDKMQEARAQEKVKKVEDAKTKKVREQLFVRATLNFFSISLAKIHRFVVASCVSTAIGPSQS